MNEAVLAQSLFIAFAVFAWFRFPWAIAIVLFLLPAYALRFTVWGMPTTALELMLLAVIAVWIAREHRRAWTTVKESSWRWPALALLVVAFVAVIVSPDRTSALGYWKAFFVEPLLFFFLLVATVRSPRGLRLLLVAAGGAVAVIALVALLQAVGLMPSLAPWNAESPQRFTSVFAYPNAVGLFVAPLGALFIGLAVRAGRRSRAATLFLWGVVGSSFAAASFAVSRGAFVALALALFVGLLATRWKRHAFVGALLVVVMMMSLPAMRTTVMSVMTGSDTSTDVRLALWQGTARMISARPLFGAGLGGFPLLYGEYKLAKHTEFLQYPHNALLNVWVELGALGVAVFAWIALRAVRAGRSLSHASPSLNRGIGLGVLLALLAMFVQGLVDVPYFKNDLAAQFWFFLALLEIARHLGGQERKKSEY